MSGKKLRILPLGGLGEIGKNMTVVEYDGRIVIVDTGLMFPTAEMLGIDLVLPDFSYLRGRIDDIEAIVLTHGHEDHVGALPYVLREIGLPPAIYGGRLTVGMVRSKLEEHKLKDAPLRDLAPGRVERAGDFGIEMIHMSHSIPDACAVAVTTPVGTILVTGDYKFDQTPVDGRPADFARLARLGDEGLLCLCGDSTNADRPGVATSESSVGPALLETFSRCDGRIIVTCFASNVHRVQQVVDAADALGRKVALVGRSMRKNTNIGKSLGHVEIPDGILIQPREIDDWPDHKIVIISTGSQGEPLSALRRMA
ncbi:MAG TPA: ribonuclease J, partial [Solirubrobacterales bacterium]|nr:ribonuclease J [Solirubrobacterales bacterium]